MKRERIEETGDPQNMTLLEKTKDAKTLGEVFLMCSENDEMNEICRNESGFFWKKTIERIFGKHFVLSRTDVPLEKWYNFAIVMSKGVLYQYYFTVNYKTLTYDNEASIYSLNYNQSDDYPTGDEKKIIFTIPGLPLLPGVVGNYWRMTILKGPDDTGINYDGFVVVNHGPGNNIPMEMAIKFYEYFFGYMISVGAINKDDIGMNMSPIQNPFMYTLQEIRQKIRSNIHMVNHESIARMMIEYSEKIQTGIDKTWYRNKYHIVFIAGIKSKLTQPPILHYVKFDVWSIKF